MGWAVHAAPLPRAPREEPRETRDHSERHRLHAKVTVDWERRAKDSEQLVRESARGFPITSMFLLPACVLFCASGEKDSSDSTE